VAFPDGTGRSLEAATETAIGDIDLAAWFDLTRPGFYRVRLTTAGGVDDGGEPITFSLGTRPKP
jgi:hypothetical protein